MIGGAVAACGGIGGVNLKSKEWSEFTRPIAHGHQYNTLFIGLWSEKLNIRL